MSEPRHLGGTLFNFVLFIAALAASVGLTARDALAEKPSAAANAKEKDKWPVPRGKSREPVPYRYDPQQWKKVPVKFLEDTPACILYSGTTNIVEKDGTIETISHEITRLNGRKGVEKLGEYRNISYEPAFQELTLNEARVHKVGGRIVSIEPKHLQLRDLGTDYQVYNSDKQLIVSFPNLEVGDVIEVKWTVRGKNPEHHDQFFTRYNFGDDSNPVVLDEMRVKLPKSRQLKYAAVGGKLEPTIKEEGDWRTYHWAAVNRTRLPQDDNLPPKEELRLQVACSTFASWEEIGKWKQKLRTDCWDCDDDLKTIVKAVTKDLKTPLEKARALTYWVRRNIRYISAGEKHAYTPHLPAVVLRNRFGDCKDTTQLLAVMMREAGIPVALATLGVLDDGQVLESVPSPWGTHAILLATIDGKDHWVDTTTSLAGWDFLPRDDRGRLCYVTDAPPAGKAPGDAAATLRLVRTPPLTPEDNRYEQTTRITIGSDGSSRCRRTVAYHGSAGLSQRDYWMEVPAGERRRLVTAELQDANARTRLRNLAVNDKELRDFDKPVRAEMVYEILSHFNDDREGSLTDSKVWGKLLSFTLDYDRKVSLELGAPFESHHHYTVQLPPAYHLDTVPKERTVKSKWGTFTLKVKADSAQPRKLEIDFRTRLESTRVEPDDFDAWRKFHEAVNKYYRVWMTLKPARDIADVTALEAVLALAPEDTTSASILATIYQQNDKLDDARRVLERARHYKPTEAGLWELSVAVAQDPEQEEELYREMVKRFPDEARYGVALGTTLVNRDKYDDAKVVLEPITEGVSTQRGQAHYQLARSNYRQNKVEKALEHLEAAGKADHESMNNVPALQFKARVHEKLKQTKEAIEVYQQSLKIDPNASASLSGLIQLALKADDRETALVHLRRLTALAADAEGLATAAGFHLRLNRLDDAFDLANRALKVRPSPSAERTIGLVHYQRGEYDKAVDLLDGKEPDAATLVAVIRSYVALGNLEQAAKATLEAKKLAEAPDSVRQAQTEVTALVKRQGAILNRLKVETDRPSLWKSAAGRVACAERAFASGVPAERIDALLKGCFAEKVELGPAYALRGEISIERGRMTAALADAERAVKLSPEEARPYYVRGRVRLERGASSALADLTKAVKLSERKDANMLHWLAAAQFRAKRHDEALSTQREAVKLKPHDKELGEQLKEFESAKKADRKGR